MNRRDLFFLGSASFGALGFLLGSGTIAQACLHGRRIGRISNFLAPGYGDCFRCHTNWGFVDGHSTQDLDERGNLTGRGCFPLCEACWTDLGTPEARMPYYRALYEWWGATGQQFTKWEDIERGVLAERSSVVASHQGQPE